MGNTNDFDVGGFIPSSTCAPSVRLRVEEDMAALFRRAASLTVAPVVCRRFSPLVLRLPARGELPLWKGLSSLKGLLSSNRAFGSTDLGSSSSALTCGVSLFRTFRTVFLTLSPSRPFSVSEALACLLLA